jgi:phenylalanyl-tRNA synthetase alpha chain
MQNKLDNLKEIFLSDLEKLENREQILQLQNKFLGKKGELKAILAGLKDLSIDEKKEIGKSSNILKNIILEKLEEKNLFLEKKAFEEL